MKAELSTYSRRDFLALIGAAAGLALLPRRVFPHASRPYHMLVVGDSIISGQGLQENQKSYTLVKQWLEAEVFKDSCPVALKVKAHSGASINIRAIESDALREAGIDENKAYPDEVNVTFPSVRSQVDTAAKEYGDPAAVDLILLTGGITDVRLTAILDPFRKNAELRQEIEKHCYEDMLGLLRYTAKVFPRALIVVLGYYPFLSKYSEKNQVVRHALEIKELPDPLQAVINNSLARGLYQHYTKKMVERSLIWADSSAMEMKKAVARLNADSGRQRALFVTSPIKEENSLGTKNSLLFELDKKDRLTDPMASQRKAACLEVVPELRQRTKLKLRTRVCEIAGIGHPNPTGAKLIAAAIEQTLQAVVRR